MILIYAFYLDVFFLHCLFMNASILILTFQLMKIPIRKNVFKISFGLLGGVAGSVMILLIAKSYRLYIAGTYVFAIPFMLWFSAKMRSLREYVRTVLVSYGVALLLGGISAWLGDTFLQDESRAGLLIFAVLLGEFLIRNIYQVLQMKKYLYQVELENGNYSFTGMALYDSGNRLREPYGNHPVHIVSEQVLEGLHVQGEPLLVPFQSLGNERGMLEVYQIERMKIKKEKDVQVMEGIYLGKAEEQLFSKKSYQIILNAAI